MNTKNRIAVAFSGGLDTTYCAAWLKESAGAEVVTVTVDTGGFAGSELHAIERRSREAGAARHITLDGRRECFDRVVRHLIAGNCLRGGAYPLCVSAERVIQAELLVKAARELSCRAIAHGSTGAGNDQIRFDVAIRSIAPDIEIMTPIRDQAIGRAEEVAWLAERGIRVEQKVATYSINSGMWGTTIGGGEIHDAWKPIPDSAYPTVVAADQSPEAGAEATIAFERGVPVSLDGERMDGPALVARLTEMGAMHGVGRGVHVGDTIIGIKGRIAFEAPAAAILIAAHREIEKLVLTRWQQFWKEKLADFYGMLLHEALFHDPAARDIEALIASSQRRVTGEARVALRRGQISVTGVRSPFSLLDAASATYGEGASMWDGRDAEGFAKIYGLQGRLARVAEESASSPPPLMGGADGEGL